MVRMGMVDTSRRDEIVELRKAGKTYKEIGLIYGISRERVRQILKGRPSREKPDLDSKILLRPGEVAQLLGLHVNTVRRWSREGILKSYRITPWGDRRFKREDIDRFLEEGGKGVNMAQSEKCYCPICKWQTTFICQDSGCFCSVCGYKEEKLIR